MKFYTIITNNKPFIQKRKSFYLIKNAIHKNQYQIYYLIKLIWISITSKKTKLFMFFLKNKNAFMWEIINKKLIKNILSQINNFYNNQQKISQD